MLVQTGHGLKFLQRLLILARIEEIPGQRNSYGSGKGIKLLGQFGVRDGLIKVACYVEIT